MPELEQETDPLDRGDGEAAVAATLQWLATPPWPRAILPATVTVESYADLARSLADALAANGLSIWADRLAALAGDADAGGSQWGADAVRALLDEAGLRVAEQASHPQLFAVVDDLWELSPAVAGNPVDALCHRLAGATEDHPLCARLAERIAETARVAAEAETRQGATPRTRELWPGPDDFPIERRWAFQAVRRLWPERFMAMLQQVPPVIAHAAILASGPLDLDALEHLLQGADGGTGAAGQDSPAALYALFTQALPIVAERVETADEAAGRTAAARLVAALATHRDWPFLSRAWLQQLVWHGRTTGLHRPSLGADAAMAARDLLIDGLAASAPPLDEKQAQVWIMLEEELWRVDRVVAEAAILTARGAWEAAGQLLASAVLTRQATSTARDQALRTNTPEYRIVGSAIANLADPATWFAALWERGFEARERSWFDAAASYNNPDDPALAWGLAGVNRIADPAAKAALWHKLSEAMTERILTDAQADIPSDLRDKIIDTAVFLGTHFQIAGIIASRDIMRLLAPLIAPTPRFLALVDTMLAAGGRPLFLDIAATADGQQLGDALTAALSSVESEDVAVHRLTPEAIGRLRDLLDELRPGSPPLPGPVPATSPS